MSTEEFRHYCGVMPLLLIVFLLTKGDALLTQSRQPSEAVATCFAANSASALAPPRRLQVLQYVAASAAAEQRPHLSPEAFDPGNKYVGRALSHLSFLSNTGELL